MVVEHPYATQPPEAYWKHSVTSGFSAGDVARTGQIGPLLRSGDRVMSAGSCFASNLVPWLEEWGMEYVRTELPHPVMGSLGENLGYRNFSAAYGNVYSARQFRQLLERATRRFKPIDDRWMDVDGRIIDAFRPGLRYPAESSDEFELLTMQHLEAVERAVERCSVIVLTLGLTESWESKLDGAVYPTCPGTIAGEFDPARYGFRNFNVDEVAADTRAAIEVARCINPSVRFLLTVSPVPLVATATIHHVLTATVLSKSVLRAAAQLVVDSVHGCTYFPAYELVTGPQAPWEAFEADRRNVSRAAVAGVMDALMAASDLSGSTGTGRSPAGPGFQMSHGEVAPQLDLRTAECDEVVVEILREVQSRPILALKQDLKRFHRSDWLPVHGVQVREISDGGLVIIDEEGLDWHLLGHQLKRVPDSNITLRLEIEPHPKCRSDFYLNCVGGIDMLVLTSQGEILHQHESVELDLTVSFSGSLKIAVNYHPNEGLLLVGTWQGAGVYCGTGAEQWRLLNWAVEGA